MTSETPGWVPDVLGPGFEQLTLTLGDDDEGEVVVTLVRHRPEPLGETRPARAVLAVHGWNDYFFNSEHARFWTAQGAAFYAIDLRKYGRSLRPHQTPNYVADLATYDEDLGAALEEIRAELGTAVRVMLVGHSTGGLVSVLWADRFPGVVDSIILNSPWLELQGTALARFLATPTVGGLARYQAKTALPNLDPGHLARAITASWTDGGPIDAAWRPSPAFPVRGGWLQAILQGHARVQRGLDVRAPVLLLASARSSIAPRWNDSMLASDSVIDVEAVVARGHRIGRCVTIVRIEGGLHDLLLSATGPRAQTYAEIARWTAAYGWG